MLKRNVECRSIVGGAEEQIMRTSNMVLFVLFFSLQLSAGLNAKDPPGGALVKKRPLSRRWMKATLCCLLCLL